MRRSGKSPFVRSAPGTGVANSVDHLETGCAAGRGKIWRAAASPHQQQRYGGLWTPPRRSGSHACHAIRKALVGSGRSLAGARCLREEQRAQHLRSPRHEHRHGGGTGRLRRAADRQLLRDRPRHLRRPERLPGGRRLGRARPPPSDGDERRPRPEAGEPGAPGRHAIIPW
jgi:hypothetical protein